MSQKKVDSKLWYGLATKGVVAASASAVSLLYINYRKNANKKTQTHRQKEKKCLANQKKKENTNGQERQRQDNENQTIDAISSEKTQAHVLVGEEKAKGITDQEKSEQDNENQPINPISSDETQTHVLKHEKVKGTADQEKSEVKLQGGLSKEELIKFLRDLCEEIITIIRKVTQIQMDETKSEKENLSELNLIYQDEVEKVRSAFLAKYKTTDEECSHALNNYIEDKEVKKYCSNIDRFNQYFVPKTLTQEEIDQIPESFTVDRLLELLKEMNSGMQKLQQEIFCTLQALRGQLTEDELQKKQRDLFEKRTQKFQKKILAKYEVDEDLIPLAMKKYQKVPKLQNYLMTLQRDGVGYS